MGLVPPEIKAGTDRRLLPPLPLLQFYMAFAIFSLGDRVWTFVNAFFFELLGGMRLVSLDQFVESCSAMLLSTWVGNWLDRHNRAKGAMAVLTANNLGLALSALLLGICMFINGTGRKSPLLEAASTASLVLAIALSALTKCAAEGQRLVFTKDWIVVLARSGEKPDSSLSKKNATMVVIDQLASVLGPLLAGFLLIWLGHKVSCALIVGWNLFSLVCSRVLLANVYRSMADLAIREGKAPIEKSLEVHGQKSAAEKEKPAKEENRPNGTFQRFPFLAPIRTYYRQPVFPAAFGLALLYATVLGFDGLAVSFGKAQSMQDDAIGMFRSVSSVLGLLGALSFAPSERRIGLRRTGLVGLSAQHLCLWLCVLSIWLPGSPFDPIGYFREWTLGGWLHSSKSAFEGHHSNGTLPSPALEANSRLSIFVFFTGITLARFGLWMADLAILQLMQLHTPEAERGSVFGVQNGFCQLFSMLKDVLVILLPDPRTFGLLTIFSIFCVGFGFVQYIHYLRRTREGKVQSEKKPEGSEGGGAEGRAFEEISLGNAN